jgi:hypothetical protein
MTNHKIPPMSVPTSAPPSIKKKSTADGGASASAQASARHVSWVPDVSPRASRHSGAARDSSLGAMQGPILGVAPASPVSSLSARQESIRGAARDSPVSPLSARQESIRGAARYSPVSPLSARQESILDAAHYSPVSPLSARQESILGPAPGSPVTPVSLIKESTLDIDGLRERLERLKTDTPHPAGIPSAESANRSIRKESPLITPAKPKKDQQSTSAEPLSREAARVLELGEIRDQRIKWLNSRLRRLEKPHVRESAQYMLSALDAVRSEMQYVLEVWKELDKAEWELKMAQKNSEKAKAAEKETGKDKKKLKKQEKEKKPEKRK